MKRTIKIIVAILAAVALLAGILLFCRQCKDTGDPPAADTTTTTTSVSTTIVGDTTTTTGDDTNLTTTTEQAAQTTTTTAPEDTNTVAHVWSEWTVKAATCTAAGSKTRTCADCGETQTQAVAAAGHKWDSGKETGSNITYTCTVCGSTKTEQIKGNHTYGEWKWEEYTFKHSSGGTYTSHRKYRTCTKCGFKEVSGSDHICQKGSDNHTVTTVKAGTCTTKATMRSTCKVCGWYVEYEGSKGKHTIKTETRHLTDYGTYTNELDTVVSECTSCGTKEVSYTYGQGFSDYNRYRNTIVLNQGSAFASRSPSGADFLAHPTWQTVIRDYKYDSEGYVKQFTVYWHDASGNRYSYVVDCTPEHLASWFAEYGLTGGSGYKYQLKISGNKVVPYKVSWTS